MEQNYPLYQYDFSVEVFPTQIAIYIILVTRLFNENIIIPI